MPLPVKPKPERRVLPMLCGALIGSGLAFVLILHPEWLWLNKSAVIGLDPLSLLFAILYFYAALYAGVIIHEAGHLAAGLLSGYRIDYMRVGPIQIHPPFKIFLKPRTGIGAAGFASLFPRNNLNIRKRAVMMVAGGPLANLITGGLVLVLPKPHSTFAMWFLCVSLLIGSGNLLPFTRRGAVSDGRRILTILRRTPHGERYLALKQIYSALWNGTLSENIDPELLRKATAVTDCWPDTVAGYIAAYSTAYHQNNDAEASRFLETALQYSPFVGFAAKEALLVEAAVFQAIRRKRIDLAEQWLNDVPQKTFTPGLRGLAEAAILEARQQLAAALAKLDETRHIFSSLPGGFQRDVLLSSLARKKAEISLQLAATPVQK